jgi:hypothetical protein
MEAEYSPDLASPALSTAAGALWRAASCKVFGVYVILTGINLMIAPNLLLGTLGVPPTNEVWLRVVWVLGFVLVYYHWACGVANSRAFFKATRAQ